MEDHRTVTSDRLRLRGEALQLDVAGPGDASGVPLVLLAHVDQLDLAAVEPPLHLLGRELVRSVGEHHGRERTAVPRSVRPAT